MPASSAGTENAPVSFVTTSNVVPVALLLTTTVAPGMTPPPESTTTPESEEVAPPWAYANVLAIGATAMNITIDASVSSLRSMEALLGRGATPRGPSRQPARAKGNTEGRP